MSNVQMQIDRIRNNIDAAYIALEALGVEVPEGATVDELAALINDAAAAHLDSVMAERIIQTTGTATDKVMSQKATTEAIQGVLDEVESDAYQEGIVQQVIAALGTPVFGRVDVDNNIILTGELAEGTYTLKYEGADGNVATIGTLTVENATLEPAYINQISISTDTDGTIYNGKGWKEDTYLSSSSYGPSSRAGIGCTGFIPVKIGDVVRLQDVGFDTDSSQATNNRIVFYDSSKAYLAWSNGSSSHTWQTLQAKKDSNNIVTEFTITNGGIANGNITDIVAYMRICTEGITSASIITINQEIA